MKKNDMSLATNINNEIMCEIHKKSFLERLNKNRTLLLMCLPSIVFFFIFSYITMPGVYIAFVDYNYADGMFGSPFCGLKNFEFLMKSGQLWTITRNTILYNLAFILLGNTLQVFMAILLNEVRCKWFKKVSQTIMFLPYFISAVIVGLFAYNILNYDYGVLNNILNTLGIDSVKVYSNPNAWPFIIVLTHLWQSTGYGTIVYFAAIMGIDSEIMEAAQIDGANAIQRIRYITLPLLKPTFIILLLFALGSIMRGNFGLFYNLVGSSNAMLLPTTDIIDTFVFRSLMGNFNFSLASAVSLYQSVFGFAIVMMANWIIRKIESDYALF